MRTGEDVGYCIELVAALLRVRQGVPEVMTVQKGACLPAGPFEPAHRSLQSGMRSWVERHTGVRLGHIEQLYTFGDAVAPDRTRLLRISYMALTREHQTQEGWESWYRYFPWEDRRDVSRDSERLLRHIVGRLVDWAGGCVSRQERVARQFGLRIPHWENERVLDRYELMWEAGLLPEAPHAATPLDVGASMYADHRRILATAIGRIRAKCRYTPALFRLVPEEFTLLNVQETLEAVSGQSLHKQNFRRLIHKQGLVVDIEKHAPKTSGRPARLFRLTDSEDTVCMLVGANLPLSSLL